MKQWLGWMTIGLLAVGLGACGKEVKPTATVNTSTPTSGRHFPAMTATPGLPAPTLTPTLTPVPPAYPVGSTATPLPYPLPTLAGGYPGSQYSPPTPTPTAVVDWFVPVTQVMVFPPDGGPSLNVQCENGKWVLFSDWDNNNKVSEFVPPASAGCPAWVEWSPDYESAALVSSSKEVYLWATDGALPQFVGNTFGASEYIHPHWSPDSLTLAFIITDTLFIQPRAAPVSVVSSSGKHIAEFEVGGGTEGEDIYWLASNVLCRGDRAISPCYKASTGKYLFDVDGWHIVSATGLRHQSPSFSPDNRWVIVDHSIFKQETLSGESAFLGAYVLYDIQTTRDYPLPPTDYNLLVFTSWAEDNSAVYLISRPKHPSTMPARDIPFGLLSFNPQTQQFNLLFEQAVSVSWNLDKIWALVVFPSRNPDGTLGLSAGVWQVGTEFMPARVPFSEAMIYADPGWDDYFNRSSFGRPAWSHDGRRVVLGDAEGRLTLMDVDGTVQLLAVDESGASRLDVRLRWSPDDRQIWVQYGTRVWVVTPP